MTALVCFDALLPLGDQALERLEELQAEIYGVRSGLTSSYSDFSSDGSGFSQATAADLALEEKRRAKYEELTGKRLLPWDEVPPDFEV